MNDEEPQYICLNYCMVDQETGAEIVPEKKEEPAEG